MYTRRQLGRLAMGAVSAAAAAAKINSKLHGVQFGLQTYSFISSYASTPLPPDILDVVIKCMAEARLAECDMWSRLIEPVEQSQEGGRAQARANLTKWRMETPLTYFEGIRKKFARAGIEIWGASGFFGGAEAEIDRYFETSKALGVKIVSMGGTFSGLKVLAPLAEKHNMLVGIQGRPDMKVTNPDSISKPEQYVEAVGISKYFRIVLDIGDATAGGWDALNFVREHPEKIALLYVKDRKKDNTSLPWGEGDTRVAEILRLIRDKKYPIRCYVDNDYKSPLSRSEDVKRNVAWAKKILAS